MTNEDSFPELPRPVRLLVRFLVAIFRYLVLIPLRFLFFLGCLMGGLFARKDINAYKVHSLFSLVLNLIGKLL